jgi:hypothetical protein
MVRNRRDVRRHQTKRETTDKEDGEGCCERWATNQAGIKT